MMNAHGHDIGTRTSLVVVMMSYWNHIKTKAMHVEVLLRLFCGAHMLSTCNNCF